MDTNVSEAAARKALEELSRHLRVSLTAILAYTAALRNADAGQERGADWCALVEAIQREGNDAVQVMNGILDACTREGADKAEKQPQGGGTSKAYTRWLRSRLEQIEVLTRDGRKQEAGQLAQQLKESAASMGYLEVSEAAAAVQRLSQAQGQPPEAAVEILRRVVNRAMRRLGRDAA